MQSELVDVAQPVFLFFRRYVPIEGVDLKLCRVCQAHHLVIAQDVDGLDCFWETNDLIRGSNAAGRNREWTDTVAALPVGKYRVYLIAAYDNNSRRFNEGQLAVSAFELYSDRNLREKLC